MIRCKPLLGTFVEITVEDEAVCSNAIEQAFDSMAQVQLLMGFHNPHSELYRINRDSHVKPVRIHPWTAQVLSTAQAVHRESIGIFNCGVGQRLVEAGLLPKHCHKEHVFGGIEHIQFMEPHLVHSDLPLCLDLGGIAKGFAVDVAVQTLQAQGIEQGSVNAGGDFRVFGNQAQAIHIRNPAQPHELFHLGALQEGAIATSSLYFARRASQSLSYMVHPRSQQLIDFSPSYSVIAKECIYADALTKVIAISGNTTHPCLAKFSAQAIAVMAQ